MINYERRKRQANENSDMIIKRFAENIKNEACLYPGKYYIQNDDELMKLVEKISRDVRDNANDIHPDWSIPIILEAVGKMYYGNQQESIIYGPIFKRALVYLWNINQNVNSSKKNLESLLDILKMCYVLETIYGFRRFFLIDDNFSFEVDNGYLIYKDEYKPMIVEFARLIRGRGKRLRIADINSKLMNKKSAEFSRALINVLGGVEPKSIELFQGTFYEEIPGISNDECKKFWQSIFFRYRLYLWTLLNECADRKDETDFCPLVTLFPEGIIEIPEGYVTQEIIQDTFWNREWLNAQDEERYGNLIVERPIMRITPDGDFATCSVLIGDSINYFIEGQILNYTLRSPKINLPDVVFKNAVSAPFENKVINELRKIGFCAGHVTDKGIWLVEKDAINLNRNENEKLYGEVDTLAYDPVLNFAILVECKVINDVRDYKSYKNIVSKLVDDGEGFHTKILKKSKWIDQALSNYYDVDVSTVNVILTDIPIPIVNFSHEDIFLTDYDRFIQLVMELLEEYRNC